MILKNLKIPSIIFSWIMTGFALVFMLSNFSSVMTYSVDVAVADNYYNVGNIKSNHQPFFQLENMKKYTYYSGTGYLQDKLFEVDIFSEKTDLIGTTHQTNIAFASICKVTEDCKKYFYLNVFSLFLLLLCIPLVNSYKSKILKTFMKTIHGFLILFISGILMSSSSFIFHGFFEPTYKYRSPIIL